MAKMLKMPIDITQTPNYQVGKRAESVVKYLLEQQGYTVEPPPDVAKNGASRVDFLVSSANRKFLVEVKFLSNTFRFDDAWIPCVTIKKSLVDAYEAYANFRGLDLYLYFLLADSRYILSAKLNDLKMHCKIAGRQFPQSRILNDAISGPEKVSIFAIDQFKIDSVLSQQQLDFITNLHNPIEPDAFRNSLQMAKPAPSKPNLQPAFEKLSNINAPKFDIPCFKDERGQLFAGLSGIMTAIGFSRGSGSIHVHGEFNSICQAQGCQITAISYGKKKYWCIPADDVPRVLEKYSEVEVTGTTKRKRERGKLARELLAFWNKEVLNQPAPVENQRLYDEREWQTRQRDVNYLYSALLKFFDVPTAMCKLDQLIKDSGR